MVDGDSVPVSRPADDLFVVGGDPMGTVTTQVVASEPGVTTVVVAGEPSDWSAVVEAVGRSAPRGRPCRLVAAAAAREPGPGLPSTAQLLARRMSSEVFAATGAVLVDPGRSVTAIGRGWVRVRPDGTTERAGWRCPAPWWDDRLRAVTDDAPPGVRVEQIPAGIWVYAENEDADGVAVPDETVTALGTSYTRITLLLGRPGHRPPPLNAVARVVDTLPADVREHLFVVAHGVDVAFARTVADLVTEASVRA